MNTVWLVRWPQIASKVSFWLSITGYKRSDRSLNESIYRIYLVLFFTGWSFMVLPAWWVKRLFRLLQLVPVFLDW